MQKLSAPLLILLTVAVLAVGLRFAADASEDPEFWYSTDPELELLRIEFFGGMLGRQSRYSLYADGRLAIRRTAYKDLNIPLSAEQVHALVSTAVEGQLVTVTKEREATLRNLALRYTNPDAGAVRVTLQLPRFKKSAAAKERAVHSHLTLTGANPASQAPEVACVLALTRAVLDYEKQHRDGASP